MLNPLAGATDGICQRELGDRMETADWVRRTDHREDRRVYLVGLTPAGRALWTRAEVVYPMVVAQVTAGLPVSRMSECTALRARLEQKAAIWELNVSGTSSR